MLNMFFEQLWELVLYNGGLDFMFFTTPQNIEYQVTPRGNRL